MEILSLSLEPNENREPFFDCHWDYADKCFVYPCGFCKTENETKIGQFLSAAIKLRRSLSESVSIELEGTFKIPSGKLRGTVKAKNYNYGSPYFGLCYCDHCNASNLVCIGFTEVQPMRYRGILWGVANVRV